MEINNDQQRKKCSRCGVNLTIDHFKKKRDDTYQRGCMECNEKIANYSRKYVCCHDRRKNRCKQCYKASVNYNGTH